VAAVGLAGFIGFGLAGKGAVDDMRKPVTEGGCAPTCSQDQVDAAKTKLLIGDIALGVGIGALAGAFAVYFLTPPEEPKPTARVHAPRFNAAATPEGARASVSLTF